MLFYILLLPLALALTIWIMASDIPIIYKQLLSMIPPLAVVAGIVGDFREGNKGEDNDE